MMEKTKDAPPQILRIKRRRGSDPLQALVLDQQRSTKKQKKDTQRGSDNFYFKLTRSGEKLSQDESVIQSVLSEATGSNANEEAKKFVYLRNQKEEDTIIPNELTDMVSSFLSINQEQNANSRAGEPAASNSDYVYDVYQLTSVEPFTTQDLEKSKIGYIRFFNDEDSLLQSDDENVASKQEDLDDEDSNAESYYQNDYPSDEDAGGLDDEEKSNDLFEEFDDRRYQYQDNESNADFDNLYDDIYGDDDDKEAINFLSDGESSGYSSQSQFERNHFFEGEEDDELAIHRDAIFGKLQRMIDERS